MPQEIQSTVVTVGGVGCTDVIADRSGKTALICGGFGGEAAAINLARALLEQPDSPFNRCLVVQHNQVNWERFKGVPVSRETPHVELYEAYPGGGQAWKFILELLVAKALANAGASISFVAYSEGCQRAVLITQQLLHGYNHDLQVDANIHHLYLISPPGLTGTESGLKIAWRGFKNLMANKRLVKQLTMDGDQAALRKLEAHLASIRQYCQTIYRHWGPLAMLRGLLESMHPGRISVQYELLQVVRGGKVDVRIVLAIYDQMVPVGGSSAWLRQVAIRHRHTNHGHSGAVAFPEEYARELLRKEWSTMTTSPPPPPPAVWRPSGV